MSHQSMLCTVQRHCIQLVLDERASMSILSMSQRLKLHEQVTFELYGQVVSIIQGITHQLALYMS